MGFTSKQSFAKTVELGSLTAVATMGTSPQMVGKHVGALEERLGTQLLRRTTQRQSLTETDQAFYERCSVTLSTWPRSRLQRRWRETSARARAVGFGSGLPSITEPARWGRW